MSAAGGMVLVAFAALGCLGFGGWLLLRARTKPAMKLVVACAALLGAAAFLIVLLGSGLRHFGGHVQSGGYTCAQWWVQIDAPHGLADDGISPDQSCRRAALDAVGTVLSQAALVAAAWAAIVSGYLVLRRRTLQDADSVSPG
jgi:hypothetical protein